jgi:hypothetical protein
MEKRKPAVPGGARESQACPCTVVEITTTKSKPFKRNDQVGSTFWFHFGGKNFHRLGPRSGA